MVRKDEGRKEEGEMIVTEISYQLVNQGAPLIVLATVLSALPFVFFPSKLERFVNYWIYGVFSVIGIYAIIYTIVLATK